MRLAKLPSLVRIADLRQVKPLEGSTSYGQGRGGRPWRRKRARVLARDNYTCQQAGCGVIDPDCEVDHDVPLSQGGSDDESNLRAICPRCHKLKTARESAAARGGGGGS